MKSPKGAAGREGASGHLGRDISRRSLIRSGIGALLGAPLAGRLSGTTAIGPYIRAPVQDDQIVLGVSAAFSGPSRGLGTELYRGSMACFNHVNENGGVNGRRIVLKLLDDGYQPDPCVANTIELMQDESVFLLFNYVGTPTVTRALPVLKKFRDQQVYLFFPFTGAEPQREPPYGEFAFNLRASYRQETAGLVDNFVALGRRRVAVFYQNDAYGRSGWAGVREALTRHGEAIAGEATYTRGTQFTASMRRQVEILQSLIDQFVQIQSIRYIYITSDTGEFLAHTFVPGIPDQILASDPAATEPVERSISGLGDFVEVGSPILSGVAGTVHVGMDLEKLALKIQRAVGQQLFLLCIILVVGVLASIWLVNLAAKPLGELLDYVAQLARERGGDVAPDESILVRDDEIGDMARLIHYVAESPGDPEARAESGG